MRKQRRYREKNASKIGSSGRFHDFLRGWGTQCKDGSILWDTWRPLTKKQQKEIQKRLDAFAKNPIIKLPLINREFPKLDAYEIINTQPMT